MTVCLILFIAAIRTEAFWFGEESALAVTPENPFVFVGENLTLTCKDTQYSGSGNIDGNIAGWMYFKLGVRRLSEEFIRVMSERSIQLKYPILSGEDGDSYGCYMNGTLLGQQMVQVEYRPQQVTREDVMVQVDDWSTMRVSWYVGDHWVNPDRIESHLLWRIKGSFLACPVNTRDTCLWREHDGKNSFKNVPYLIRIVILVFNSSRAEIDRSESEEFHIDTNLYVKPAAVVNLTADKVSNTSVCLSWNLSLPSSIRDVQHHVHLRGHRRQKNVTTSEAHVCVDALSPFTKYIVNVSTLPLVNGTTRGYKSDSVSLVVTTEQDVPSGSPAAVLGCFHFSPCKDSAQCQLTIYWQAVPEDKSNGRITTYNINVTDRESAEQETYHVTGSQRSLDLLVGRRQGFLVTLFASTEAGPSKMSTTMLIPEFANKPAYPALVLVEGEHDLLYVNWEQPREVDVISYTLFYCNTSKVANKCLPHEHLQWFELPADKTNYSIKVQNADNILTGVSVEVNQPNGAVSSGIAWSTCTFNRNKKPGQPENVFFSANQPNMALTIEWDKPGCRAGEPYILYYVLQHCRGSTSACTGPISSETIANSKKRYTITDLNVGVSYRVMLRAVSRGGDGPSSDPIAAVVGYSGLSSAQIAGIAIAAAFFLIFVLAGIVFFVRRMHRGIQTFKLRIDVPAVDIPPTLPPSNLSNIRKDKPGSTKKAPTDTSDVEECRGEGLGENVSSSCSRNVSTSESTGSDTSHTPLIPTRERAGKEAKLAQLPTTVATQSHSSNKLTQDSKENTYDSNATGIFTEKGKVVSSYGPGSCIRTTSTVTNADNCHTIDNQECGSSLHGLSKKIRDGSRSLSANGSDNLGFRSNEEIATSDSNSAASYSRFGGCFPDSKKTADKQNDSLDYVTRPS